MEICQIIEDGKLKIQSCTGQERIYTIADLYEIKKEFDAQIEDQTATINRINILIIQCQESLPD